MDLSTLVQQKSNNESKYVSQQKLENRLKEGGILAYANLNGDVYSLDCQAEANKIGYFGNQGVKQARKLADENNGWQIGFKGLSQLQQAIKTNDLKTASFIINHQAIYTNANKKLNK